MASRRNAITTWSMLILVAALLLQISFGIKDTFGPKGLFQPLVQPGEWIVSGDFPEFKEPVEPTEVPGEMLQSPSLALWRSWAPDRGGTIGTVMTRPFAAPRYMAIPFQGFPAERQGNRIYLRCDRTGSEKDVATMRTNNQWATAFVRIEKDFCPENIRLIATAVSKEFYVAVGTPFVISRSFYAAQNGIATRALAVFGTWLVSILVISTFGYFTSRGRSTKEACYAGFAGLALTAMVVFLAFMVSPTIGYNFVLLVPILALVGIAFLLVHERAGFVSFLRTYQTAAVLWLCIALAYTALVSSGDNGGGSWAINGFFTPLRWSTDNQLPFLLSEGLYQGRPLEQMVWGPWLASDRTPLLSAFLLLPRALVIGPLAQLYGSSFVSTAYMAASITFLSAWAAILFLICTRIDRSSVAFVLVLAATSPFFLFNSVFTWGKLLGATYVLIAFAILRELAKRQDRGEHELIIVACCASAAYLAHASNAFVLVPLALAFLPTILRQGPISIAAGGLVAIATAAPWLYWQVAVQPGGNALLRFALAGDFGFDHRSVPVLDSARAIYERLGLGGWLGVKAKALRDIFAISTDWRSFGETALYSPGGNSLGASRVLDFFVVARSIGIAGLGLLILPVFFRRHHRTELSRASLDAAVIGLTALMFTLITTFPQAVTHHQAYGALVLLFAAGAWTLSQTSAYVKLATLIFAVAYCGLVWVWHPLSLALRLDWQTVVFFAELVAITGFIISSTMNEDFLHIMSE